MKKVYVTFGFLLLAFIATAQQPAETDTVKVVNLNEVQISSYYDIHARNNKSKTKDGQARTERLLETIPGINIISRGNFAQEPVIRGLSDGQVFVTINGMKIFGACTDRMDPATSYIEPNNLRSVKLSNGAGFDAGGATVGGGLSFVLKKPELNAAQQWQSSAGVGFETNARARQFLGNVQYSSRKFALSANGIYRKAGNYTPGGDKSILIARLNTWNKDIGFSVDENARLLYSQYEKWNAGINAIYQFNEHHFLNADIIVDRGKNIGYPALTMDVAFANAHIASLSHEYKNHNKKFSSLETRFYFNHINHAMDDTKRPSEQLLMHMDMPGYSWTGGFFSKGLMNLAHQQIKARVESYVNRWHAEMTMYAPHANFTMFMMTMPDVQRGVTGVDVEDDIHAGNRLNIKVGGRAELNTSSVFSNAGLQQLSVIYDKNLSRNNLLWNAYVAPTLHLGNNWQATFKAARAGRAATLKELYAVYLFNRVDCFEYIGNPGLKNEEAYNFDAEVLYRSSFIYFGVKGFSYFFKNYIAGIVEGELMPTMGSQGVKRYQNLTAAKTFGGELMAMAHPFKKITVTSINTYQKGEDVNGNALPLMAPFHTTNKIEWQPYRTWNLFLESAYAAKQNRVSRFYGEKETPAFHVLNAGVVKTIFWKENKMVLSATGFNLFNSYYYEHVDVLKLPRLGRNIVLHATVYF